MRLTPWSVNEWIGEADLDFQTVARLAPEHHGWRQIGIILVNFFERGPEFCVLHGSVREDARTSHDRASRYLARHSLYQFAVSPIEVRVYVRHIGPCLNCMPPDTLPPVTHTSRFGTYSQTQARIEKVFSAFSALPLRSPREPPDGAILRAATNPDPVAVSGHLSRHYRKSQKPITAILTIFTP